MAESQGWVWDDSSGNSSRRAAGSRSRREGVAVVAALHRSPRQKQMNTCNKPCVQMNHGDQRGRNTTGKIRLGWVRHNNRGIEVPLESSRNRNISPHFSLSLHSTYLAWSPPERQIGSPAVDTFGASFEPF
ncbi:hypothetical protein E2C01_029721 [Portunus trituberculatus]|uniref:Uncharacterized protein n=1 Tax=Portunus trituberculatus TaxID=210409 RepID=A0A5B7ET65_PORTR|nr:hypothetical protein [Portunus trituberculatus]